MLRNFIISIAFLSFFAPLTLLAQWNDAAKMNEGKEPARTQFISYDRRDDASTYDPAKSPFFRSLNGEWRFLIVNDPSNIDDSFYMLSGMAGEPMAVPGYWAEVSSGDYEGIKPPKLPVNNAVGQYRLYVDIPVGWLDRDIFIRLDGIKSGAALYVNGKYVGYSENSSVPAEFNISKYVTDGRNYLGLEIYKYTTGTWLESGTMTGSGIESGVYLYSQPKVHIQDFIIKAELDSIGKTGLLTLDVIVANNFNVDNQAEIWYDLMDAKGDIIRYNSRPVTVEGKGGVDTVRFEAKVPNVKAWSAETPNLYQVMLRTRYNGRFTEYIPFKVGFKTVKTVADGAFSVNGKPVTVRAADINEKGLAPDEKAMREHLRRLKQDGVNSLKLITHPSRAAFLQLCDELGFYVLDYVNIDASLSGTSMSEGGSLGNNPAWVQNYIDRAQENYSAERNYASVTGWALNESAGPEGAYNIYRLQKYMRETDPGRSFGRIVFR